MGLHSSIYIKIHLDLLNLIGLRENSSFIGTEIVNGVNSI